MLRMIELSRLNERAERDAVAFREAKPFKHLVFDDLLRTEVRDEMLAAFPASDWPLWDRGRGDADPFQPKKLQCHELTDMPEPLDRLVFELNSGPFLRWLEKVTGVAELLPDPYLFGGGLHSTGPGGKLVPHIDFHYGAIDKVHRRLNLLVYLNEGWQAQNNGALELWDQQHDCVAREVYPEYGRTVIFQTDADSMHGFSKPIVGRDRNSLALYYYTVSAPDRYSGDYATHWRSQSNGNGKHSNPSRWVISRQRSLMFGARVLQGVGFRLTTLSHKIEACAGRDFPSDY